MSLAIPVAQVIQSATSAESNEWSVVVKCSGPAEFILPTFAAPPLISITGGRFVGTTVHGDLVVQIDSCQNNRAELRLNQNTFLPSIIINWMLEILLLLLLILMLLSNRFLFDKKVRFHKKNFEHP